MLHLIIMIN